MQDSSALCHHLFPPPPHRLAPLPSSRGCHKLPRPDCHSVSNVEEESWPPSYKQSEMPAAGYTILYTLG